MYATIRRYTQKTPATREDIEALRRRIEETYVPLAQEIRGFHSYAVLNVGNRDLFSINVFEDREGAAESSRRAAEFVERDPLKDQLSRPEVFEGELLVLRESGAAIR